MLQSDRYARDKGRCVRPVHQRRHCTEKSFGRRLLWRSSTGPLAAQPVQCLVDRALVGVAVSSHQGPVFPTSGLDCLIVRSTRSVEAPLDPL